MKAWSCSILAALLLLAGGCDFGEPTKHSSGGGTGVEGIMLLPEGSPATGAWVKLYETSDVNALAKGTNAPAVDSVQTSATGTFRFKKVADGTYNIAAALTLGDNTVLALYLPGIAVKGNTNIGVNTLEPTGDLVIQVRGTGTAAVPGALCVIAGGAWQAFSDSLGVCAFKDVPQGTFQVTITHPTHQAAASGDVVVVAGVQANGGLIVLVGVASPLPAAPLLVYPSSSVSAAPSQPALVWRSVGNATSYHVQVAADSGFGTTAVNDSGRADTALTVGPLAAGTRYYWRARARNAAGVGPWSATWTFMTAPGGSGGNLIAYWDFNETAGGVLHDRTGNGHDGAVTGAPDWVADGAAGGSLRFNGSTHVVIPASGAFSSLGSFTLSAWIWQSSQDQSQDQPLLEFARANKFAGVNVWLNTPGSRIVSPGMVFANLRADGHTSYLFSTGTGVAPAGTWNHVAVTYEAVTGTSRIFINGAQSASYSRPLDSALSLEGPLYLGFRPGNSLDWQNGYSFSGRLDEVRIYGAALTAAQIDSAYKAVRTAGAAPKLIAHWDFNEGSGTTLTDRTGKGHTGTITGGTWTTGVRGGALSFNGSTTQVLVPFQADLNLAEFTLSAWVKTSLVAGQVILSRQTAAGLAEPWNYRLGISGAMPEDKVPAGHANADHLVVPHPPERGHATGPTFVADGQWHHLVAIARRAYMEVYVDGRRDTLLAMLSTPPLTSTEPLKIGSSSAHPYDARFLGEMDEIRIYDGAISPAQVDSLHQAHKPAMGWTARASNATGGLYGVAWSDGLFVLVGLNGAIRTSGDGLNWTVRSAGTANTLFAVAKGPAVMTAVGQNGAILTSVDGITWIARTSGTTNTLAAVTWSGSLFVATGAAGTILTSPDGATWTPRASGTSATLYGVTWTGSRFVTAGSGGTILTSTNGTNWAPQTSGITSSLYAVHAGGTTILAAGANGVILASSDGITWTARNSGTASTLYGITRQGSTRVVVGAGGTILTSANDGVAWSSSVSGVLGGLYAVSTNGSRLVAVGEAGTILTMP